MRIKGKTMYCAIMGDIIDSRNIIEDRSAVQERYKAAMQSINDQYKNVIESNLSIIEGDGFYGLLHSPEKLMDILLDIRLAILPYQIRIGIGIGDIGTVIIKDESNVIDGRANATAREAIDCLSENKKKYETVYRTTMLMIDDKAYDQAADSKTIKMCKTYETLINTIFCACSGIEKKWNRIHADTIELKKEQYTQREIAVKLGITQPAVQGRLAAADWYAYVLYLQTIESGLAELWKGVQNA